MDNSRKQLIQQFTELISALQKIKFICQRAKSFGVEESDIVEILKIISRKGI